MEVRNGLEGLLLAPVLGKKTWAHAFVLCHLWVRGMAMINRFSRGNIWDMLPTRCRWRSSFHAVSSCRPASSSPDSTSEQSEYGKRVAKKESVKLPSTYTSQTI